MGALVFRMSWRRRNEGICLTARGLFGSWAPYDYFFLPDHESNVRSNSNHIQQPSFNLAHRNSCSAEMSRLRKSVEALADASSIADCCERLTEAKACLSTVPSHSARSYWERTWLNRADRFADALCPINRLGTSRRERRYIFLDKPNGVSLSKGWALGSLRHTFKQATTKKTLQLTRVNTFEEPL